MAAPTLQATVNLPSTGSWTSTPYRASPILADVNNDGKDDLITVTAGAQLVAYGTGANGSVTPLRTYSVPGGVADIKSTPIVITDPRTGRKDLFAAMGRDESRPGTLEDGRVFGWDLQTGQLLPGFTQGVSTGPSPNGVTGVYGALTAGDLDGDGVPEIVATSFSSNVTAIKLDGSVLWQWTDNDTIISGAVIADIDRSGKPSVIVGGDSSASPFFQDGGWVNVLTNTGQTKWRRFIPGEVTWATPTLADLNNNGNLDIVIGTGLNFDLAGNPGARAAGNYLYALDPYGNILPGWPYHLTNNDAVAHQVLQSVAAGDLLGNGQTDIVAIDRAGYLHAIAPNGQALPGFVGGKPIAPDLPAANIPDDYASPVIADVNGDGRADIIAAAGPFLRAFDSSGNQIWSITTNNVGGLPEGIDSAPAIGFMNGGNVGTLALVTYNPNNTNRPDQLLVYQIPQTSLTAPWPLQRRTAAGGGIQRSNPFDRNYVSQIFRGAINGQPDAATTQGYVNALDSASLSLYDAALNAYTSPLGRQAEITRVYQAMLGHAPDAAAIATWSRYLATYTVREMELMLAGGPEFAQVSGNTLGGQVSRLYTTILGRSAAPSEVNAWVATGQTSVQIATALINGNEGINYALNTEFAAIFGPGTQNSIAPDTRAAFAFDYRRGAREEVMYSNLLANNGNYAASNVLASYTRDLYRDILQRNGSPAEVANWVNALDTGAVTVPQIATLIINSLEARGVYIQQEFQTLLGRNADQATINALISYPTREALIVTIVGSPEYYARSGGTIPAYISAVSRDLAGISPVPQSAINDYTALFSKGAPLTTLALNLISNPGLYFTQTAIAQLTRYIPDGSQGVLRTGVLPANAAGQPVNPNPALVSYLVGLSAAGVTGEQAISILLSSTFYTNRISYYKGIYRAPGIRN